MWFLLWMNFQVTLQTEAHKHFKVETAGLEDELCSWGLILCFLLGQIYTEDILLLDALFCHVWWGRGVSAGKYCEYFSYAWVEKMKDCNSSRMQSSDTVLSSVDPLVWFRSSWLTESLVAVWTHVRFFSQCGSSRALSICTCNKSLLTLKAHIFSHTVCLFWCTFKFCRCEKLFPHKEHECGFSFEWTFRWLFRLEVIKNVFPHWSHSCSLSPVWILMWNSRLCLYVKLFPHWSHSYSFSPVWMIMWLLRCAVVWNSFCTDHICTVSLQCGSSCVS